MKNKTLPKYTWKPPIAFQGETWRYFTHRGSGEAVEGEIHSVETKYSPLESAWHLYDIMRKNKAGYFFHDYVAEHRLIERILP